MNEQPDRARSRSDTAIFLACLLLATGMLFAPHARTARLHRAIRNSVLVPLVWMQLAAVEGKASR